MSWVKARFKQVMGRKKETDGIALRNRRLQAEGRFEKQWGRSEERARHSTEHR